MVIHVAEEALTGETFPTWISRVAGVDLSMREFLVLNGLALLVVVIGTALALRWRESGWPVAALGTAVATNVVFHLSGAGLTGSWSPGLASATILWLPLGAFALVRTWRRAPRVDLAIGIAIGFVAHGLVSLALVLA